jgi:3,4-dihydroxy-2-butanone 4-phosphate synthase
MRTVQIEVDVVTRAAPGVGCIRLEARMTERQALAAMDSLMENISQSAFYEWLDAQKVEVVA